MKTAGNTFRHLDVFLLDQNRSRRMGSRLRCSNRTWNLQICTRFSTARLIVPFKLDGRDIVLCIRNGSLIDRQKSVEFGISTCRWRTLGIVACIIWMGHWAAVALIQTDLLLYSWIWTSQDWWCCWCLQWNWRSASAHTMGIVWSFRDDFLVYDLL